MALNHEPSRHRELERFAAPCKTIPASQQLLTVDTVHRVLERAGVVEHRKPRRRRSHSGAPLPIPDEPNATWTADFKGEFKTRDGYLCFPLTIKDGYSRFLLECRGMLLLDLQATMRRFRAFNPNLLREPRSAHIPLATSKSAGSPATPRSSGKAERSS